MVTLFVGELFYTTTAKLVVFVRKVHPKGEAIKPLPVILYE